MSGGENSPANGTQANDVGAAEPKAVQATQKVAPEGLVLRASPRRVVRFRRGVIISGAAIGSLAIAGVTWMALGSKTLHIVEAGSEKAVSDRRTPADAVADLPGDYSKVKADTPVLGPPLPGDLGRPILEHQRGLASQGDGPVAGTRAPTAAQQGAEAERQRIASQAYQAREAGVLVQSSGWAATSAAADAAAVTVPGQSASSGVAGLLALDPEKDQNNQQRKIDFMAQQAMGGTASAHRLEAPASPYQLMAGSIIAASLVTGLNSDLPGMVVAQVTEPVFDTVTGRILLIPQGARLIGSYDSVVAFGQRRALLAWQRIILPDGSSIQIDNLPATRWICTLGSC